MWLLKKKVQKGIEVLNRKMTSSCIKKISVSESYTYIKCKIINFILFSIFLFKKSKRFQVHGLQDKLQLSQVQLQCIWHCIQNLEYYQSFWWKPLYVFVSAVTDCTCLTHSLDPYGFTPSAFMFFMGETYQCTRGSLRTVFNIRKYWFFIWNITAKCNSYLYL